MNKIVWIVMSVLILWGCKKEKANNEDVKIAFTGVTMVDEDGNLINQLDSADWRMDDKWVNKEAGLFSSHYGTSCTPDYNYQILSYPNPTYGVFYLHFNKKSSTHIEFRLVDKSFRTLLQNDSITVSTIALDATSLGITDTVRMYYKFVEGNCEFRGHGDIVLW